MSSVLAIALWLTPMTATTAVPAASEILERMDRAVNWFHDCTLESKMVIKQPGGESRELTFVTFQRTPDKRLLRFSSPGDVKGMGVLVENAETMYVFLPGFQRVRRMGTHVSKQSFMGSDFSSEDMAQLYFAPTYDAQLAHVDERSFLLELTLRPGKESEFPRLRIAVDRTTWMPTRIEYLDRDGRKLKTQSRSDFTREADQGYLARTIVVTDHRRSDHTTEVHLTAAKVNTGLQDSLFSVRSLLRGD